MSVYPYHLQAPQLGLLHNPPRSPTQEMSTYLPQTALELGPLGNIQPVTTLRHPNPAAALVTTQAQQVNIYLIKQGVCDSADPIIDKRIWMLSETNNLGMACPSRIIEQARGLALAPIYIITLHTESFSDAVNLFRSDFFLPKSLHSCIKYLHIDRKCENLLKNGMADEGWRKEFDIVASALLRTSLRKLRRCWCRVQRLGYQVTWSENYDSCSVWIAVEVGRFGGIPMGL